MEDINDDREVDLVPSIITAADVGATLLKFLPPLVQNFTATLQRIVDEALEGTNALTDERLGETN